MCSVTTFSLSSLIWKRDFVFSFNLRECYYFRWLFLLVIPRYTILIFFILMCYLKQNALHILLCIMHSCREQFWCGWLVLESRWIVHTQSSSHNKREEGGKEGSESILMPSTCMTSVPWVAVPIPFHWKCVLAFTRSIISVVRWGSYFI